MLTVGSLFAGIGGFDLGLERAGMRSVWQCEIDGYCQRVLAKHWPSVLRVPDVRDVRADTVPWVDVICGGFPCQDLSYAGKGAGLDGERSGLWSEYARVLGDLRPRYVIVENVSALLARGLGRVLGDLAALGFDAEWDCIPASAFGAPHRRDRIWLVAYTNGRGLQECREQDRWPNQPRLEASQRNDARRLREAMADANGAATRYGHDGADAPVGAAADRDEERRHALSDPDHWLVEPDVGRVADGVPARVDRLRGLGNALVPQIAEWIGRRILDYEEGLADAA